MPWHEHFVKVKVFFKSPKKSKGRPSSDSDAHEVQPSLSRITAPVPIPDSSNDRISTGAQLVMGTALDTPIRSTRQGAATKVASLYPTNAQNGGPIYNHPLPPLPPLQPSIPQTAPATANTTLQQGNFAGAHDFIIYNAQMNDGPLNEDPEFTEKARRTRNGVRTEKESQAEEEKQAEKALQLLAIKGIPGAMLDSKDRGYVPRCNEDTRTALRGRIVEWGRKDEEPKRLLWLSGPAGVGKSAVAQTVAEELKEGGLLGGVFFFSRPNNRSDPDAVVPTLVYQLALQFPEYQRIIARQLKRDPLILNRNRRSQFKELIINPFLSLTSQLHTIAQKPLVIVLDGLDECNDREAQCEFVEMISHHMRLEGPALRLRWMICSRPEPDIKVSFSSEDCKAMCLRKKLEVHDTEAQKDARRILNKGFAEIRQRYPDQLTQEWPDMDQVRFIAERASGHLGFASFIVRFVGDKVYDDPFGQLQVCLRFLKQSGSSKDLNPLHALDLLYTQILSDIPANIFSTTRHILGLLILYGSELLTAAALVNFLGHTQQSFYRALRRLHSVITVPSSAEAATKPIQVYHASFADYLKDPARAGKFVLDEGAVHFDVAMRGLSWLGYCRKGLSSQLQ
ncbi:hypothetical protein D9756_006306 [Leucocoprinus leucothites]|uniref:NACHT domain-containing protein n=1 Tax=Leucocoprinus leucothites TaxID=201217 RepID=A0A8H5D2F4_9AGAR|nr:hypothetical protein D9756_006306 [Leucoagaricus leucothites]